MPPAAQGKNLSDFDHVKKGLALVGEEELAQQAADPMFGIKVDGLSEDVKRAMGKLNSADAAQARPCPGRCPGAARCPSPMRRCVSARTWGGGCLAHRHMRSTRPACPAPPCCSD